MESVDLDMDDLFGGEEREGEELQMPAGLPDLDEGEEPMDAQGEDADDDAAVLANIKNLAKGAAKKRVQKPQPKLDGERLKSSRGLPGLTKLFEDVKFKGKGQEASDLKLMMGRLEHWAHRLFPKLPFDDFIERLERLGGKRDVLTCLKRIRLDMPLLDSEFVGGEQDDQEQTENQQDKNKDADDDLDAEEAFDEMIRQEQEKGRGTPGASHRNRVLDEEDEFDFFDGAPKPVSEAVQRTPSKQASTSGPSTPATSGATHSPVATPKADPPGATSTSPGIKSSQMMTESQQERLERNKRAALAKRAARLGVPLSALASPKTPASQPSSQTHQDSVMSSQKNTTASQEDTQSGQPNSISSQRNLTQSQQSSSQVDIDTNSQRLSESQASTQDLGQTTQGTQDLGQTTQGSQALGKTTQGSLCLGDDDMQTVDELICGLDEDMETECDTQKPLFSGGTPNVDSEEYSKEIPVVTCDAPDKNENSEFSAEIPVENCNQGANVQNTHSNVKESEEFSAEIPVIEQKNPDGAPI